MWPLDELKESALGAMRKAIPSPEEQRGEGAMEKEKAVEKEAVALVSESTN